MNKSKSEWSLLLVWAVYGSLQLQPLICFLGWRRSTCRSYWAASIELVDFLLLVLINKLVNVHVTASNSYFEHFPVFRNQNLLSSKIVDTFASYHALEHDLEFVSVGMIVDVLCHFAFNRIIFDREVDFIAKVRELFLKTGNLNLCSLKLLQ